MKKLLVTLLALASFVFVGCAVGPDDGGADGSEDEDEELAETSDELKKGQGGCSQSEIKTLQTYCRSGKYAGCPAGKKSIGIKYCYATAAMSPTGRRSDCACK